MIVADAGPLRYLVLIGAGPGLRSRQRGVRSARTCHCACLSVDADRLLMDEWRGRAEAERRHLFVTGTLGVLAEAHRARLLDFEAAFAQLRETNFYISMELVASVRRGLSTTGGAA